MKWIELTDNDYGHKVFINTDHVTEIWDFEKYRTVSFDTGADMSSILKVKESYDKIQELILMDENHACFQEALDNIHNLCENNT